MSAAEVASYVVILLKADHRTGIWLGSAVAISSVSGGKITMRTARKSLAALEKEGYIKRFLTRGDHCNYPILIHRFECSEGKRLNALDTTDCNNPVYDDGSERCSERCSERASIQEVTSKNKENKQAGVLVFNSSKLKITATVDEALALAFPHADRNTEYAKMHSWLMANPRKKKKNFAQFAHNWFSRITAPAVKRTLRPGWDDELDFPLAEKPF